ncbi:insulin-like growth factor-binding protein complex acid labile subunit isoform X1 [Mytilus californianus]|uniref:insulin-like growth factor-binding protein complex acid labile subunit isoform X1 n=1 Tax=Mytilus californianus TaxID=6549 RepID=UPI0022476BED|nr:insulin-like growth factor-binding protein complex acid labile subunit isoform X1 [Mytilus californianus]XP_052106629.1 insulin-like growth factor-binding protein complex acid labile subunit isoform X1 [Mytilus californianus]XP_052106630.1 insulin-like growth factor-binding protein complex acid labile subunit isoform X1 [Mytilus californianus]
MKKMYCNVALGLLMVVVSADMVVACPNNCTCTLDGDTVNVYCDSKELTVFPENIPSNAVFIKMDSNYFTTVEEGAFQNLSVLYAISMNDGLISTIETGAFVNLPNMVHLTLINNQISTLQQGAFQKLPYLRYLRMQDNNLLNIESKVFINLIRLHELFLYNNQITTIQQGAFQNLPILKLLDLSGNKVVFVRNDTFDHLPSLQILSLRLVCDCKNFPFWSWLKTNQQEGIVTCLDRGNDKLFYLPESVFVNCTNYSCHPEYCLNGGSCSQNSYGDLLCTCVGNWTGATCTVKETIQGNAILMDYVFPVNCNINAFRVSHGFIMTVMKFIKTGPTIL